MRSAFQITSEAERLGAQVSSGAGVETSSVRLSALKTNLTPSLALLADIIRNPSFTQADIDRVRTIWLAHIGPSSENRISGFALGRKKDPSASTPHGCGRSRSNWPAWTAWAMRYAALRRRSGRGWIGKLSFAKRWMWKSAGKPKESMPMHRKPLEKRPLRKRRDHRPLELQPRFKKRLASY